MRSRTRRFPQAAASAALLVLLGTSSAAEVVAPIGRSIEERIEGSAVAAIVAAVPSPDRFEAIACRADVVGSIPEGEVTLEAVEVDGPSSFGIAQVHFRVLAGGKAAGEARATVRGIVRGPVVVAIRPIARGSAVPQGAVVVRDAELTRLTGKPLRSVDELAGLAPTRTLGAGRVVTRELLSAIPVVRRGGPVDLKVVGSGMTVTARGVARADGAPGERIRAMNLATKTVVLGEVQGDGSLVVIGTEKAGR